MDQRSIVDPTLWEVEIANSAQSEDSCHQEGVVRCLLQASVTMRSQMATLIDHFELAFPVIELPLPAVERYRMVPMQSLDFEVEFEDADEETESFGPMSKATSKAPPPPPPSDRYLRARCWASEE